MELDLAPSDLGLVETLLALHRSEHLDAFKDVLSPGLAHVLPAEASGVYLFPSALGAEGVFLGRTPPEFLERYERLRARDPLLQTVLTRRVVVDNIGLLGYEAWHRHPLSSFLDRFGCFYSVQAPIVVGGDVVGTVNFARAREHGPFQGNATRIVHGLSNEIARCLARLLDRHQLEARVRRLETLVAEAGRGWSGSGAAPALPSRAPGLRGRASEGRARWTPRTWEAARLAAEGQSNKAIARRMRVSENTVKDHLKKVFAALQVQNRTQLARALAGFDPPRPAPAPAHPSG